jgi:hypothetical protein
MDRGEMKERLTSGETEPILGGSGDDIGLLWSLASDPEESKELRKRAKRALYILRSKGIDVDGAKPKMVSSGPTEQAKETVERAMLSLPDSGGRNLLILAATDQKTLSLVVYDFLIDLIEGILDHRVRQMRRRALERVLEDSGEYFPVPVDYAFYRLKRALQMTPSKVAKRISSRLNLDAVSRDCGEVQHPALGLVPATLSRIATPTEEKRLFSEKEIGRLVLPEDEVHEYSEQIEEAMKSRLIIGNRNPQQRVEQIIDRFCTVYFTEEKRRALREMLLDIALFFHHKGESEYTRILVDYGEGLLRKVVDIKSHPVVQFLTYRAFLMKG